MGWLANENATTALELAQRQPLGLDSFVGLGATAFGWLFALAGKAKGNLRYGATSLATSTLVTCFLIIIILAPLNSGPESCLSAPCMHEIYVNGGKGSLSLGG